MTETVKVSNGYQRITHIFEHSPQEIYLSAVADRDRQVFIRLFNPGLQLIGQIKLGFHFMKKLCIGRGKATLNAMNHPLMAGEYAIEILAFCRTGEDTDLEVALRLEDHCPEAMERDAFQEAPWFGPDGLALDAHAVRSPERRWYKGDFHGHTTLSDGNVKPKEVHEYLQYNHLDIMALTEHNLLPFGFPHQDALMIPSYELTLPDGHLNIHGVKSPDILQNGDSVAELISGEINPFLSRLPQGVNVSINHMFMVPWAFTYQKLDMRLVNTFEVICDPTYRDGIEANDKAVRYFDFLWTKGIRIWGIGGSDSHNRLGTFHEGATLPSIYGDPATYVFCDGLSIENVLDGIGRRHCYTSRFFKLDIQMGGTLPGEEVHGDGQIPYEVTISSEHDKANDKTFTGRFISNDQTIYAKSMSLREPKIVLPDMMQCFQGKDYAYLRFGLYDDENHVVALVNPVWRGAKQPESTMLGNLLKEFESYDPGHSV